MRQSDDARIRQAAGVSRVTSAAMQVPPEPDDDGDEAPF
jgi:hypothetical protein